MKDFQTFCPKAIAGIGHLPDTVADRAIPIALKRRTDREPCARWRERDGHAEATPLREQLVAWAGRAPIIEALRSARPSLPGELGDRQADVWEPLLAIADLAGDEWPDRARRAALALAGSIEDSDFVVELLCDVADILNEFSDTVIPTKDLLAKLVEREDRPWATWRKDDKPITGRGLARLLGPLGIHPTRLEQVRGYRRDAFNDALARYPPMQVSLCHFLNETGPESLISMCQSDPPSDASQMAKQADIHCSNDAMTHRTQDKSQHGHDHDLDRF